MNRVILLSPGGNEFHLRYARACMSDSLRRGESPISPMLLFTQPGVAPDTAADMIADILFPWLPTVDSVVVYADLGTDDAMERMLLCRDSVAGHQVHTKWRELGWPWTATNCWGRSIADVPETSWPRTPWEKTLPFRTDRWWL